MTIILVCNTKRVARDGLLDQIHFEKFAFNRMRKHLIVVFDIIALNLEAFFIFGYHNNTVLRVISDNSIDNNTLASSNKCPFR